MEIASRHQHQQQFISIIQHPRVGAGQALSVPYLQEKDVECWKVPAVSYRRIIPRRVSRLLIIFLSRVPPGALRTLPELITLPLRSTVLLPYHYLAALNWRM